MSFHGKCLAQNEEALRSLCSTEITGRIGGTRAHLSSGSYLMLRAPLLSPQNLITELVEKKKLSLHFSAACAEVKSLVTCLQLHV